MEFISNEKSKSSTNFGQDYFVKDLCIQKKHNTIVNVDSLSFLYLDFAILISNCLRLSTFFHEIIQNEKHV